MVDRLKKSKFRWDEDSNSNFALLRKAVGAFRASARILSLYDGGVEVKDAALMAEVAKYYYEDLYGPSENDLDASKVLSSGLGVLPKENQLHLCSMIYKSEVSDVVHKGKNGMAPREDGLIFRLFKLCQAEMSEMLAELYNQLLASGIIEPAF